MSRFKVGDYVQVRYDLQEGKWHGEVLVVKDMKKYEGIITKIKEVFDDNEDDIFYTLENDKEESYWTDDMLIGLGYKNLLKEDEPLTIENIDKKIIELLQIKAKLLQSDIERKQRELEEIEKIIKK